VQRPTHTHGRGRDGIASHARRCRPRAIQHARLVRRCCRAPPSFLLSLPRRYRQPIRRERGVREEIRDCFGRTTCPCRLPTHAEPSNSLAFARGRTGKRWPFSGAPHAPPLVSSPRGRRKEKKVRVVATCEQASAGYLVWRVASWVAISTKRCTTAHAHFSVYKQDRTKPLKLFLLGKPSL
jgi:hypothetical protein